jgi:hypothetical protein
MWIGRCGSGDVDREMWIGRCGSGDVDREMWIGRCGSGDGDREMGIVIPDSTTNRASPETEAEIVILRPVTRKPMPAQASAGRRI